MIGDKTIAVVVPAYNEESQIGIVIETMPGFVDRIVIVDDCSNDDSQKRVAQYIGLEDDQGKAIPQKSDQELCRPRIGICSEELIFPRR